MKNTCRLTKNKVITQLFLVSNLFLANAFAGQVTAKVDVFDVKPTDANFTHEQCKAILKSHTVDVNKEVTNVSVSDSYHIDHSVEIQVIDLKNGERMRLIQGDAKLTINGKSELFPLYMTITGKRVSSQKKEDLKGTVEDGFIMDKHCSAKVHVVYE